MTDIFTNYDDLKAAAKQQLTPKMAAHRQFTVKLYRKFGQGISLTLLKAIEIHLEADDCFQYGTAAGLPLDAPSMQFALQQKSHSGQVFVEWWNTGLMPEVTKRLGRDRAIGIMLAIFSQLVSFTPITTMRQMRQAVARVAKSLNLWRDGCKKEPPNKGQSKYQKHWKLYKRLRGLKKYKMAEYSEMLHQVCLRCEPGYASASPIEKRDIKKTVRQGLSRLKEIEQRHAPKAPSGNLPRAQRRTA